MIGEQVYIRMSVNDYGLVLVHVTISESVISSSSSFSNNRNPS